MSQDDAAIYHNDTYYVPPLVGEGISDAFVWRLSDVWRLSRTSDLSREQRPRKTKIGTEVAHVTWLGHQFQGQKVKGQGHQAALLSAALTRGGVRHVQRWQCNVLGVETTATLRLLGGARGAWAPRDEERGGGISCRHAHSLYHNNCTATNWLTEQWINMSLVSTLWMAGGGHLLVELEHVTCDDWQVCWHHLQLNFDLVTSCWRLRHVLQSASAIAEQLNTTTIDHLAITNR